MKKKLLGIVIIVIVLISMLSIYGKYIRQYNSQGISLRPCITIDVDCPEEFVCEVSGFKVYEVNLEEVYFINVKAEEVSLKKALEEKLITMEEILAVCKKQNHEGKKLYLGENYKIIQSENTYLFAPLDYDDERLK